MLAEYSTRERTRYTFANKLRMAGLLGLLCRAPTNQLKKYFRYRYRAYSPENAAANYTRAFSSRIRHDPRFSFFSAERRLVRQQLRRIDDSLDYPLLLTNVLRRINRRFGINTYYNICRHGANDHRF